MLLLLQCCSDLLATPSSGFLLLALHLVRHSFSRRGFALPLGIVCNLVQATGALARLGRGGQCAAAVPGRSKSTVNLTGSVDKDNLIVQPASRPPGSRTGGLAAGGPLPTSQSRQRDTQDLEWSSGGFCSVCVTRGNLSLVFFFSSLAFFLYLDSRALFFVTVLAAALNLYLLT
jgi:hypothetical protein